MRTAGNRYDVMTEATSPLLTKDYLCEQLALLDARQRAELYRALSFVTLVIIGTLTAILWALVKL